MGLKYNVSIADAFLFYFNPGLGYQAADIYSVKNPKCNFTHKTMLFYP